MNAPKATNRIGHSAPGNAVRISVLTWRKRVPQKRRRQIVAIIRRAWPTAEDRGDAMELTMKDADTRDVWLLLLVNEFSGLKIAARKTFQAQ